MHYLQAHGKIRLSLPIMALLIFHSARARRERLYPATETVEPVITKEEYLAMKAAKEAAQTEEISEENATESSEPTEAMTPVPSSEGGDPA